MKRLKQNRSQPDSQGTPRQGKALLTGLLRCGHCGWRMQVGYHSRDKLHYRCQRSVALGIETPCRTLTGCGLDELISRQVLKALEPAAIELSLIAQSDLQLERQRLDRHWQQNLKRARYEVESAERRYRAVDPENRLVAATLEKQWEDALQQERQTREEFDRVQQRTPTELSPSEVSKITSLSSDIAALWNSPETTHADHQSIIRCLVERVVIRVEANDEHTDVVIHWIGGFESHLDYLRPVACFDQLRDYDHLKQRVLELWEAGHSARQTAAILNSEGFHPPDPTSEFKRSSVQDLRNRLGLRDRTNGSAQLTPHEWGLRELARHLKMRWLTLRQWAMKGWVHARQTTSRKRWILWADDDELERLHKLLTASSCGQSGYPPELTTPKNRLDRP